MTTKPELVYMGSAGPGSNVHMLLVRSSSGRERLRLLFTSEREAFKLEAAIASELDSHGVGES